MPSWEAVIGHATTTRVLALAMMAACGTVLRAQSATQAASAAGLRPGLTSIVVDGELNDPAWDAATPLTGFLQRDPLEGAPASFSTEVRIVVDASAIYVAVRAFDPEPDRIVGFLTRRDADSSSDWIQVFIDSYHDRRTAYQFAVNPAGVKQDVYWFNDAQSDDSWDAVWDGVAHRDAEGWCAEFRIPLSQLRFRDSGDGRLGFAVIRQIARLNETSTWPLLSKGASGFVSSFGELTGVTIGQGTRRLEVVPYVVGQLDTMPLEPGNPFQRSPDPGASVGVDLKYAVTPALNLTATVNPDFGQVEADPAVVNLSAFETFFPEKRPFFIEGSGTYQFDCRDCSLFYSRRIGRAPRAIPVVEPGGYSRQPAQSTILGAGKLTGRIGEFSLGILAAATQEEWAAIASGDARRREVVEPGTFYSVSRARREFSDQSSLGFIVTTTTRNLAESVSFLPDTAIAGGIDYDWRLGRRFAIGGSWSASHVSGSPDAIGRLQRNAVHAFQRPDSDRLEVDPLAGSLNGHASVISFGKIAGARTRMNVNVGFKSPGFEVNDLGFEQRADEIPQSSWLQLRWDSPGTYVRNIRLNFNQWSTHNFDGDRLALGGNINGHWQFQNLWSAGFGVDTNARRFDDRLTRGGPGGLVEPGVGSWQYFGTNDRRLVNFNWNSSFGGGPQGHYFQLEPSLGLRPVPSFSAEFGFLYNRNVEDAQWVGEAADSAGLHYVFGRLEQQTSSLTIRANYTLTPNLSLQVYAQPFTSTGTYADYKELADGRVVSYAERYQPYAYGGDADFKVLSFRTTNVLRWEYRPGSTLFVVWQQRREGNGVTGPFAMGRDYDDVFSTPSANAVIVKVAYWLNP